MKLSALLLLPLAAGELAFALGSDDVYRAHHRDLIRLGHGARPLNRMPIEPRISPLVLRKRSARCSARNSTTSTTSSSASHALSTTSSSHPVTHQSSVLHIFTSAPPVTTSKAAAPPPPPPHTTSTPAPPPPPPATHSTPAVAKTTAPASPPPPPPSSGGGDTSSSDITAYLNAHNTVRAAHGASALTWSDDLATAAAKWADKCEFQHSGGTLGPYGENLAAGSGDYSIASAVQSWANEEPEYSSSNPQASHYTQMVWKSSTQLGCVVISCNLPVFTPNFWPAKFYVCEYFPQGNVIGAFAQNVQ